MRKPARVIAVSVTTAAVLLAMTPIGAGADSLIAEPFTGATVSNPNLLEGGSSPSGTPFIPCLTASTNTSQTPIRGCPSGQPAIPSGGDAVGSGALRLTDNMGGEATFVIDNEARPFTAGLTVDFDMYMYDTTSGSPADGIVFFVSDGSASVTQPGAGGGSLGYGTFGVTPGVAGGYVGIGFDEFGNYENSLFNGTGCPTAAPSLVPNQVGIRGPGSGTTGYCLLAASGALGSSLSNPAATSRTAANTKRHVRILIDPPGTASPKVTVSVDFGSGLTQVLQTAAPANPPATFKFGLTAGTGAANDIHEVQNFTVTTPQALPRLALSKTHSGTVVTGGSGTYLLAASVLASGGPEEQPVTVTDSLPGGMTVAALPSGGSWNCSATTVGSSTGSRTYPASVATPVAPGTPLPVITLKVAVASSLSGNVTNTARVTSGDASNLPVTASDTVSVGSGVAPLTTPSVGAGVPMGGAALATLLSGATAVLAAAVLRRRERGGADLD